MDKDFKKLYEDIVKSEWFKKAYHDKSLGNCPFVIDELEESEDERIRKELISYLNGELAPSKELIKQWLAWLEKQKCKEASHIQESYKENADSLTDDNERIRKHLIKHFSNKSKEDWNGVPVKNILAYLEKQKINTEGDFGRGYECGYQAGYAVAVNEMKPKVATATLDSEKQKEQKSISWTVDTGKLYREPIPGIPGIIPIEKIYF